MLSKDRITKIQSIIAQLRTAAGSGDASLEYTAMSLADSLYAADVPKITEHFEESKNFSGTTTRNTQIIAELLQDYIDKSQTVDNIFTATLSLLVPYSAAHKSYSDALQKFQEGVFERNTLDDMRLALEQLIRALLSNTKNIDNNMQLLGSELKNRGICSSLRNTFSTVLRFYIEYQNEYVKHNDKVNSEDIEYIIEQTSIMMKYLIRILGSAQAVNAYTINNQHFQEKQRNILLFDERTKLLECIKAGNYTFDRDRFKILFNPELVVLLNEYDNIKNALSQQEAIKRRYLSNLYEAASSNDNFGLDGYQDEIKLIDTFAQMVPGQNCTAEMHSQYKNMLYTNSQTFCIEELNIPIETYSYGGIVDKIILLQEKQAEIAKELESKLKSFISESVG